MSNVSYRNHDYFNINNYKEFFSISIWNADQSQKKKTAQVAFFHRISCLNIVNKVVFLGRGFWSPIVTAADPNPDPGRVSDSYAGLDPPDPGSSTGPVWSHLGPAVRRRRRPDPRGSRSGHWTGLGSGWAGTGR
jgi:hypothetical protein